MKISIDEEAVRRLVEEAYGTLAWLWGFELSDRARFHKAKKLQEALEAIEERLYGPEEDTD